MPEGADRTAFEAQFDGISDSISEIDAMTEGLSEEKLKAWKSTYANAAEHVRFSPQAAAA